MPARGVAACVAVLAFLFVFGISQGAQPKEMLGAIGTMLAVIGAVWLAGYRGGVR